MTSPDDLFKSLEGSEIPGGCDQCDAFQRTSEVIPGVWSVTIVHDDDCPFMRAKKAGSN
ncbi:MAG TPA: hypothetical protein VIJ86_10940 [Acidimicrobiales bacterium]